MTFAVVLAALLVLQTMSAIDFWRSGGASPHQASARLRIAHAAVGISLIALVSVAWDGLAIDAEPCSHLTRPSDVRSSEESVLGSCLVAAALSLIVALAATRSRRPVAWLVCLGFAATLVAASYFASHVYWSGCWGP